MEKSLTDRRNLILGYCSMAHFVIHFTVMAIPALILFIVDSDTGFDLEYSRAFSYAGIMLLLYGGGGIIAGMISDRIGPMVILLIGELIALTSTVLMVFATTETHFVLLIAAVGFSSSFYHPAGLSLISRSFSKKEDGRAYGIHGAVGNVAAFASPAISALIAGFVSWQAVFILLALFNVTLITFSLVLLARFGTFRCKPDETCPVPDGRGMDGLGRSGAGTLKAGATGGLMITVALVLLVTSFNGMGMRGLTTTLPSFVHLFWGLGRQTSANLLSLVQGIGILGQLAGGYLKDRQSPGMLIVVSGVLSMASALLFLVNGSILWLMAIATMFGMVYYLSQPSINSIVANAVGEGSRGLIFGLTFFTRDGLGFFSLLLIGFVTDMYGMEWSPILGAGFLLLAAIVGLFIWLRE